MLYAADVACWKGEDLHSSAQTWWWCAGGPDSLMFPFGHGKWGCCNILRPCTFRPLSCTPFLFLQPQASPWQPGSGCLPACLVLDPLLLRMHGSQRWLSRSRRFCLTCLWRSSGQTWVSLDPVLAGTQDHPLCHVMVTPGSKSPSSLLHCEAQQ